MSVSVLAPARSWARLHRAALAIVVLAMALAATLGVLAVGLATGPSSVPATSVPGDHLKPIDNGCQVAQPGQPC